MKLNVSSWWIAAVVVTFPFIRDLSTNGTLNTLIAVTIWILMGLTLLLTIAFFCMAIGIYASPHSKLYKDNFDKDFNKLALWKTAISSTIILSVYIYTDWTGPAIVYMISMVLGVLSVALIRSVRKEAIADREDKTVDALRSSMKKGLAQIDKL